MRGCASLISQSTQFPSGAKVGKRKICKGIFGRRRGRGDRPEKKEEEKAEEISNIGTTCNLRLLLVCVVCVCIVLLLLSLSISDFFSLSKPKSLPLSLFWSTMVVMGLVTLWAWVCWLIGVFDCLGSWAWFFWVHGFDFFGFGFLIIFLGLWVWLFSKKINKRKENIDYFNFLGKFSSSFL